MRIGRARPLLIYSVLACMLCACATEQKHAVDPPEDASSGRPQLVQDEQTPVAPELQRLAEMFVSYAVGDSDTFPHGESVSMALGGQPVVSIDDIDAALASREIWKICPADWEVYGVWSCSDPARSGARAPATSLSRSSLTSKAGFRAST